MRNACRPTGRLFCLLTSAAILAALSAVLQAQANGPAMTNVSDVVYRADGTVAAGKVLISWPAFTTADGKAVAAGALTVPLGAGGAFAASLAPNTGAQPAGVYYRVVYQLIDDTVQAAWEGEYKVGSENLTAADVWPGDSVQVSAPSRQATFSGTVREVDVQVSLLMGDRAEYAIRFANDAAVSLGIQFSKTTVPDPLPVALTTSGPSSSQYLPSLTGAQVTGVIATQISVDAGAAPPPGGGIEVRRSDGGWGASSDGNLVGRYGTQTFTLPRLSRVQEYLLRQYDNSTPAKYSRWSALVHVDYPL